MQLGSLFGLDLYVIVLGILLFLVLSAFVGMVAGYNMRKDAWTQSEDSHFTPSTILGLLALVLGFTFSMSITRFELRRDLTIKEANAISSAYLSADLLPEAYRGRLKSLIQSYLEHRIEFHDIKTNQEKAETFLTREDDLEKQIWQMMIDMNSHFSEETKDLSIGAVTKMFEISNELTYATSNRTPQPVYTIVFVVAAMGVASLGFIIGLRGQRNIFSIMILSVLFAIVIGLILDIDRPQRGLIQDSDQPLVILRSRLDI